MIYFYYGTDSEKARKKAKATVDSLLVKKPDATLVKIGDEEISEGKIDELAGSQALFANKFVVYLHNAFDNKENKELILKKIKEIGASENIFIFAEGKMDKTSLGKIEKAAEKTEEFAKLEKTLTKKEQLAQKGEKIEFFEFADALGRRDKKGLWVLFQDALREKVPAEEVHGIFFWQVKSMLLAEKTASASEANMSPYPYQKAKGFAKNYKAGLPAQAGELEKISSDLVSMYHEAHRGKTDFHIALERFVLSL